LSDLIRSLGADERLSALGVAIVAASLLLPWHGVTFAGGLVKTPLGEFGWVEVAIILTLGVAAYLVVRSARGDAFPRPLHIGTLISVSGAWTALLVAYRMIDRPDFDPLGDPRVGLRYGIFIAFAGAAVIVIGGLRMRRRELGAERAAAETTPRPST
jgi:hypothetical protein